MTNEPHPTDGAESTGAESTDPEQPDTAQLEEPSAEKEPDQEPKAAVGDDSEPSHEAVGIGVVDEP